MAIRKTTNTVPVRPTRGLAPLALAAALAVVQAQAQNPTPANQSQNQAAHRPQNGTNTVRPAPQVPVNASHWQNFKSHLSNGKSSVSDFISRKFGGGQKNLPERPQTGGAAAELPGFNRSGAASRAPALNRPGGAAPSTRLSDLGHGVPGSGAPAGGDAAPLFPGHASTAPARGLQPPAGSVLRKGADGSNLYIRHAPDGTRQVLAERADGSRVFATAHGASYVQRPWNFQAQAFDRRTYLEGGKVSQQFYRPYNYNGTTLDAYAPQRYYDPGVYQWALRSRTAPTPAAWNYVSSPTPWYNHYKGYFTPEPSYTNPLAWLTDFLMANSLIAAWNAHPQVAHAEAAGGAAPPGTAATPATAPSAAAASADGTPQVTPEVKQKVAEEVSRQIREESAEAQANAQGKDLPPGKGGIVNELNERDLHTFVVNSDLDLNDQDGRRCTVSAGDVVQVISKANPSTNSAEAAVLSSKHGDCAAAAVVAINLSDLQEMQNHMRATIDQGLANRAAKSGVAATPAAFAASSPAPDPDAAQQVEQQQKLAAAEG